MKQIVKKFNNLIEKIIFNVQNKTNDKLQISKFNRYLITFISLLFFYLFYLSIPVLYDKNWVQKNIENQLLEDFKIYFSLSSDISYRILPSPHYLVKDSKIIEKDNKTNSLAEIKILKIFISQKNFFDKKNFFLKYVEIYNADFTLATDDLKKIRNNTNDDFSKKKIKINKSKIFFKNNSDEIVSIIKISKAFLFQDDKNLINLFKLKGEVYNVPFKFDYSRKLDISKTEEIQINVNKLKLNFFNTQNLNEDSNISGENNILFLNSKIITDYKIKDGIMIFNSKDSKIKNNVVDYNGELSIEPLDLNLNIDLPSYDLRKMFNNNSILNELIKTGVLFNENISMNTLMTIRSNFKNKIFQNAKIYFNIIDGKLNIDKTRLINKKVGILELANSNLHYENNRLILSTNIIIDISNSDKLFSLLQTNKKFRKPITNLLINLDYDFLSKKINFNNIKVNNKEINEDSLRIVEGFNDSELNNWNKSKRLLNAFFEIYEG